MSDILSLVLSIALTIHIALDRGLRLAGVAGRERHRPADRR